jgi:hypothetical protein
MKNGAFLEGAEQWAIAMPFLPFDWKEGETENEVLFEAWYRMSCFSEGIRW